MINVKFGVALLRDQTLVCLIKTEKRYNKDKWAFKVQSRQDLFA